MAGYSPQGLKESDTTEWLTLPLFIITKTLKPLRTNMQGWGGKQFTSSGKAVERIQIVADVNRVPKPT